MSRTHAGESAIALHARHPTIVITAEDAVLACPAALFKALISKVLLRRHLAAVRAPELRPLGTCRARRRRTGWPPRGWRMARLSGVRDYASTPNAPRDLHGKPWACAETVAGEKGIVQENIAAEPVGIPAPAAPAPAAPAAEIKTQIDARKPPKPISMPG